MLPSVARAFVSFNAPLEAFLTYLYQDALGLMTTGMGNLVDTRPPSPDPTAACLALPWRMPDGSPATRDQVAASWRAVRASGCHSAACEKVPGNTVRLTNADVSALVAQKAAANELEMKKFFPSFALLPADAQLGLHSMAWAAGPDVFSGFPVFTAALNRLVPDFGVAARESVLQGVGIDRRNAANFQLFTNAGQVFQRGLDFASLVWPKSVAEVAVAAAKKVGPGGAAVAVVLGLGALAGMRYLSSQKEIANRDREVAQAKPPPATPAGDAVLAKWGKKETA